MSVLPVIFEDESLTGFRPLTWSQPVCELRIGLLNLRERLQHVTGHEPVLLLRDMLCEIAAAHGHPLGLATPRRHVAGGGKLLLVSGRIGASWQLLREAWLASPHEDIAWRDDCGWLVLSAGGEHAQALLTSWEEWQRRARDTGCWRSAVVGPPAWHAPASTSPGQVTGAYRRIWDLVPATAAAIREDLAQLGRRLPARRIWGALPQDDAVAVWEEAVDLEPCGDAAGSGVQITGDAAFLAGPGCELAAGVAVDVRRGAVVLGRDVRILPHCYLEGPLYIGSGSLVKAGATIYGETSLGAVSRVAGEIAESTFLDLSNKQHEGFIGHAYVGSWCNLGALTTCSDLKNTYGAVRVDLGDGPQDSQQRFVGLLMGEHGKSAIGTLFNTATVVGFASNVFGNGFPAKHLPCFTWGDGSTGARQDPERALATARTVMARRGCRLTTGHEQIFRYLAG